MNEYRVSLALIQLANLVTQIRNKRSPLITDLPS